MVACPQQGQRVAEAVTDAVPNGVGALVTSRVAVGVGVADGVRVGVGVADGVRVGEGVADGVRVGVRVGVGLTEGRRSDFRLLGLSTKVKGSTVPPTEETPITVALEIELPVVTVDDPGTVKSFQVAAPNLPFEPRRIVATPPWEALFALVVIGMR